MPSKTEPPPPPDGSYVPDPATVSWHASLPLPPNATRSSCEPRTRQQWILVEQWRILLESITILGRAQKWRMDNLNGHGRAARGAHGAAFLPLVDALDELGQIEARKPDLHNLVKAHNEYKFNPLANEPRAGANGGAVAKASSAAPAAATTTTALSAAQHADLVTATSFSVPALFSAIQELEDSVLTLRLEVEEASKLQHGLETEIENRKGDRKTNSAKLRRAAEGNAELQRSLQSAALLDRKADEYRTRLAHLQATITAQLSRQASVTGGASLSEVQALVEQNAEYERLRIKELENNGGAGEKESGGREGGEFGGTAGHEGQVSALRVDEKRLRELTETEHQDQKMVKTAKGGGKKGGGGGGQRTGKGKR